VNSTRLESLYIEISTGVSLKLTPYFRRIPFLLRLDCVARMRIGQQKHFTLRYLVKFNLLRAFASQ
jgi:hypothetical protein